MTDEDKQENKTERVQLLMSPSEVKAIDDWGYQHRIRTKAETIRWLCQFGMHAVEAISAMEAMVTDIANIALELNDRLRESAPDIIANPHDPLRELDLRLGEDALDLFREITTLKTATSYATGISNLEKTISKLQKEFAERRVARHEIWRPEEEPRTRDLDLGDDQKD